MDSHPEMTCLLKVKVQTVGWENAMTRVLRNINGVSSLSIDAEQGMARVTGRVPPDTLLKMLGRSGRHVELYGAQYGDYCRSIPLAYGNGYYENDYYYRQRGLDHRWHGHHEPYWYDYHQPVAQYFPQEPPLMDASDDDESCCCCSIM